MTKTILILILAYLSPPTLAYSQTEPVAQVIMGKALARAVENDRIKHVRLKFDEIFTQEEYDLSGKLKSRKQKKSQISGKRNTVAGFNLDIYKTLATGYDFKMAEPEDLVVENGQIYSIVEFTPKEGLKFNKNEDEFINRLRGKVFINTQNFFIWKIEALIPELFRFKYWVLFIPITIEIQDFKLAYYQTIFKDTDVETYVAAEVRYKVSSTNTRKYTYQYENYQLK